MLLIVYTVAAIFVCYSVLCAFVVDYFEPNVSTYLYRRFVGSAAGIIAGSDREPFRKRTRSHLAARWQFGRFGKLKQSENLLFGPAKRRSSRPKKELREGRKPS